MSCKRGAGVQQVGKGHPLRVRYHPGLGSGGTDEIMRPLLMTVGDQGTCYRLVKESFGRRDSDQAQTYGVPSVSGGGSVEDRQQPLLPTYQG